METGDTLYMVRNYVAPAFAPHHAEGFTPAEGNAHERTERLTGNRALAVDPNRATVFECDLGHRRVGEDVGAIGGGAARVRQRESRVVGQKLELLP